MTNTIADLENIIKELDEKQDSLLDRNSDYALLFKDMSKWVAYELLKQPFLKRYQEHLTIAQEEH